MVDPMNALIALQAALDAKDIELERCPGIPDLQMHFDDPDETPRFTYAKIQNGKVQAIALIAGEHPIFGIEKFQVGYAVLESMRGKGVASQVLQEAITSFKLTMNSIGLKLFYLEAIVSTENIASNKIAHKVISRSPELSAHDSTDEPIYIYQRLEKSILEENE